MQKNALLVAKLTEVPQTEAKSSRLRTQPALLCSRILNQALGANMHALDAGYTALHSALLGMLLYSASAFHTAVATVCVAGP